MPKAYGRQGFETLTLFKTSNRSFRCPSAAAFRFSYKINYFFEEKRASWNKIFWKKLLVSRVYHDDDQDVLRTLPNNLKSRSVLIG